MAFTKHKENVAGLSRRGYTVRYVQGLSKHASRKKRLHKHYEYILTVIHLYDILKYQHNSVTVSSSYSSNIGYTCTISESLNHILYFIVQELSPVLVCISITFILSNVNTYILFRCMLCPGI